MTVDMDVDTETVAAGPSRSSSKKTAASTSVPLHRVRFVDWQPSAVSAIALVNVPSSTGNTASDTRSLLAVGRDNGNIDLCTWVEDDAVALSSKAESGGTSSSSTTVVAKGWVVDTTLIGSNPSKVESIAFVLSPTMPHPTPRLFSTSGGAIVTEHFLPPHLLAMLHGRTQGLPASVRKNSTLSSNSRTLASQGGSVWSMAASPLGKHLAIGCEDGVVRIVDIEDGRFEMLSFSRSARRAGDGSLSGTVSSLDRAKTRIVSLAWGPPKRRSVAESAGAGNDSEDDDEDDDLWEDSFILGGTTQSSALVWSTQSGRITSKLLVDRGRKEHSIVWSVATLPDGTCVLGDSLGHVSFFDATTYTLLQGAKFASHGRNADVLALCIGPDRRSVYSASVDQKVVEYALLGSGRTAKWVCTGKRRLHAHDIRAIGIDPPYDPRSVGERKADRLPVLVSGGVDFHLVLTPASSPATLTTLAPPKSAKGVADKKKLQVRKVIAHDHVNPVSSTAVTTFADTIHRRLPFVPSTGRGSAIGGGSVVRICRGKRWLVLRREKSVAIWKLPASAEIEPRLTQAPGEDWTKVLEIQAKTKSNLVSVEVSNSGRWIFLSDLFEGKLFELQGEGDDVIPKRVRSFSAVFQGHQGLQHCPGASAASFTPDDARLIIASQPGSFLHVMELPSTSSARSTTQLLKSFGEHRQASSTRAITGRMAHVSTSNGRSAQDKPKSGSNKRVSNGFAAAADDDNEHDDKEEHEEGEVDVGVSVERTTFSRIDIVNVSPDGQYLVSVDTARRIHCFSLDTLRYHGVMPSPAQQPNAIAFNPWQPNTLCCVLPTNQIVLYDLESRRITDGSAHSSEEDQNTLIRSISEKLSTIRDTAVGAFWLSERVLIVWGASFMCTARHISREKRVKDASVVDLDTNATTGKRKGKRSRSDGDHQEVSNGQGDILQRWSYWRSWLLTKYQPLLYVGTVPSAGDGGDAQQELVVVERPYYDVSRDLPPTWFSGTAYGS